MNFKELLTRLFQEDAPDEEERGDAHASQARSGSQDTPRAMNQEKVANGTPEESWEDDHDEEYDDPFPMLGMDTQPKPHGIRSALSWVWSSIFPSPSDEQEIQAYIPHYRLLPGISGISIPFCILLEIPGLTAQWYIRTEGSTIVATEPNPPVLDAGVAVSICCAVIANLCLVIRFLERRVKAMTILCIVFLSIHDIINIIILATYGGTKDSFTYGQAFWMTLCSTIVSSFVNLTLIVDLIRTPDFKRSGSGLTRRQRSLVIIIIGLFCYIAIGALINSLLLDLTFINGLYFTVVTIETIGFGDIVPTDKGSRVFICFYATIGIINLAFVVSYVRETVLEGLDFGYRKRLLLIQEKRRAAARWRRAERRWRHAIIWRLHERHVPAWVPMNTGDHKSPWLSLKSGFWRAEGVVRSTTRRGTHGTSHRHGMKLNLHALPRCQLEAAALEAGVPLDTLLPADFYDTYDQDACQHDVGVEHRTYPSWFAVHPVYHQAERSKEPLTHRRLGAMAVMITKLGFSVYESGGTPLPDGHGVQNASGSEVVEDSSGSLLTGSDDGDYRKNVASTEKRAYYKRSGLSWGWFLIFWMGGAFIFKLTEGWPYGLSVYFCFIAFTTIGYGDISPKTPAGRSIFVVWALIGVATMTIFISVISEAYSSRYKNILGRNHFKHVVRQYHKRTRVELSEKVQRIRTSTGSGIGLVLQNTLEREETADMVEEESPPTNMNAVASTSNTYPDTQVQCTQRSLEQLPQQILRETRSIQLYMQLINDLDLRSPDGDGSVNETVWSLLDDVMGGRQLTEPIKMDILKDAESRQTLMVLGIERSLKELVSVSDKAIVAIQERDRIISALQQERGQDAAEGGRS